MQECLDCGDEIDAKRLKARPTAKVCVACQEAREATGKFKRSKMEIGQFIEGWQWAGQQEHLIPGDK